MAEVKFYILASKAISQRYSFVCKLVEKIYRSSEQRCYVLTDTLEQSQQLDTVLWTFRAGSFIPHQLYDDAAPPFFYNRVMIGFTPTPPQGWHELVLNLSTHIVTAPHIVEILDDADSTKAAGRLRYRHYQQRGDTLITHDMR